MEKKELKNYPFIDSQNLNLGIPKKSAKEKIVFMNNLRKKLEYMKKHRIRTKP